MHTMIYFTNFKLSPLCALTWVQFNRHRLLILLLFHVKNAKAKFLYYLKCIQYNVISPNDNKSFQAVSTNVDK